MLLNRRQTLSAPGGALAGYGQAYGRTMVGTN
jgi:hypothetical protein